MVFLSCKPPGYISSKQCSVENCIKSDFFRNNVFKKPALLVWLKYAFIWLPVVFHIRHSVARLLPYRWFSRYVIAAMLVDGKQKIAHYLVLFVHQHLFMSPLLFVSPEISWKPPIDWKYGHRSSTGLASLYGRRYYRKWIGRENSGSPDLEAGRIRTDISSLFISFSKLFSRRWQLLCLHGICLIIEKKQ